MTADPNGRNRAVGTDPPRGAESLLVFDTEGRIVVVDDQACLALGYSREELLRLSVQDVSPRQTPDGFRRLVRAVRNDGPQRLYGYSRRKDGSAYLVETHLWLEVRGGEERIHCSMRDAGALRDLIEARDQLISLIEHSSDAIVVTSPEGFCSYLNPAALRMVGLESLDQIGDLSVLDFHPERERQILVEQVLREAGEGGWRGELSYRNRETGAETPCLTNAFSVGYAAAGFPVGIAFVAHDISSRKAVELHRERLLELNKISRNVATSLLDHDDLSEAIGIILSGVGKIIDVSRSFLCRFREKRSVLIRSHQWQADDDRVVQLPPDAQSSEPYEKLTGVLLRGEVIRINDVLQSGYQSTEESALLRPDVKAMIVLPVVIRGKLESFFGFIDTRSARTWEDEEISILQIIVDSFARAVERRIAERERMAVERDLEHALEREKRASRYKSDFLASMSHELRTPMNAIVGYAELLGRPNVEPRKHATWLENMLKSTDHLLSLVNDVLDLSKIEAGQMTLEIGQCDLQQLISDVTDLMKGIADEKLLSMEIVQDGPLPTLIRTDPIRFKQILINLVGNAIKFTQKGGITIHLSVVPDHGDGPDNLRISVIDTGIGIAPEALEELFQPFSQVHKGGDRRYGGTGLGLDISRQLARLLGGEIAVDSEVGVGSNFVFRLALQPLVKEDAEPAGIRAGEDGADREGADSELLEGRRILIVDDSEDNRDVLRFLLQEAGCTCVIAENGALGVRAALEASKTGQGFDAILMDVNMPVMDGYEATARLLAAGLECPIIALTAMAMEDDANRCMQAGCIDYIPKPVVPRTFFQIIARHLPEPPSEEPGSGGAVPGAPSLIDNPRFAPLVERYLASFPGLIERVRAAYEQGELDDVRTLVHRIRGTASNYGFPAITDAAGACEDAIRDEAPADEIEERLELLLGKLREVVRT